MISNIETHSEFHADTATFGHTLLESTIVSTLYAEELVATGQYILAANDFAYLAQVYETSNPILSTHFRERELSARSLLNQSVRI